MKLSERLLSCASLVTPGSIVADVGTDHGYLAIYLLEQNICPVVYASDLREGPLSAARRNAQKAGYSDRIVYCLSDGLQELPMDQIDTVICAGMGGDTIIHILEAEPAVCDNTIQLVLQPQSKVADLRCWLASHGFTIRKEVLSLDGKFLYSAMDASWTGEIRELKLSQALIPDTLLKSGDPLFCRYFSRVNDSLQATILGLKKANQRNEALLAEYEKAHRELQEMRDQHDIG